MITFYRLVAKVAYTLHLDGIAEWAMRNHRRLTGKDWQD